MSVNPIPEGFHTATPSLALKDSAKAIEFYKAAFGATERYRIAGPDGNVVHAEITIGDSILMLGDEMPSCGSLSAETRGGSPMSLMLYVPDVDAFIANAISVGAALVRPAEDMFWGDRMGAIKDPFNYQWSVATHVKDVTPEEISAGAAAMFGSPEPAAV